MSEAADMGTQFSFVPQGGTDCDWSAVPPFALGLHPHRTAAETVHGQEGA
ncbi:hypothetical protein [Gymnodinialimonas sp.]